MQKLTRMCFNAADEEDDDDELLNVADMTLVDSSSDDDSGSEKDVDDEESEAESEDDDQDEEADDDSNILYSQMESFIPGKGARIKLDHLGCAIHALARSGVVLKKEGICKKVTKICARVRRNPKLQKLLLNHPKLQILKKSAKWFSRVTKLFVAENKTRWGAFKTNLDRLMLILTLITVLELAAMVTKHVLSKDEHKKLKIRHKAFTQIDKTQKTLEINGFKMVDTPKYSAFKNFGPFRLVLRARFIGQF